MPSIEQEVAEAAEQSQISSSGHIDADTGIAEKESGLPAALDAANAVSAPQATLRRDHVSNAVAFLTNSKVLSSSVGSKRAFLQSKGLTDEEIDEAFRRTQGIAPVPPVGASARDGERDPRGQGPQSTTKFQDETAMQQVKYTWTQTFMGTVVMVCAAYGIGSLAFPYAVKAWKWLTSSEQPDSSSEAETKMIELLTKHVQQQEETNKDLKSVIETVRNIQAKRDDVSGAHSTVPQVEAQLDSVRQDVLELATVVRSNAAMSSEIADLKRTLQQQPPASSVKESSRARSVPVDSDSVSVGRFPDHFPAGAADRAAAPAPLFATATPASASLFPAGAALTTSRHQDSNGASSGFLTPDCTAGSSAPLQYGATSESSEQAEPSHPNEFYSILEMVNNGVTPVGVRTDIVDKPVAPHLEPTPSSMPRKAKPWDTDGSSKAFELPGALHAMSVQQDMVAPRISEVSSTQDLDANMQHDVDGSAAPRAEQSKAH
eukprot:jgi/Ulvmu1/11567/UM079_0010.1